MMDGAALPAGWAWTTVGELAVSMKNGIYKPKEHYSDDGVACLRMYNIDGGTLVWKDIKRMVLDESEVAEYRLGAGDILVNRVNSRELVGKACVIRTGLEPCVFESKNIRLRVDARGIVPEYLNYRLLESGRSYFAGNAQQTVGMASISQDQLAAFPLPLAPLNEQRRIVDKVEELLSDLDAGVAALERARANLKRYRAAVLGAAVTGALTEEWRAAHRRAEPASKLLDCILAERRRRWEADQLARFTAAGKEPPKNWQGKYDEPAPADTRALPELPAGWCWTSLEQITSAARPICYGILMPKKHVPDGVMYVKVKDMKGDRIDVTGLCRTSAQIAANYSRASLTAGDLLLAIRGTYGRVAEVPDELEGGNITQDTARLAISPLVERGFVAWCLRSTFCQSYFKKVARCKRRSKSAAPGR
jgi:type I restriction enzyme S subunit